MVFVFHGCLWVFVVAIFEFQELYCVIQGGDEGGLACIEAPIM